MGRLLIGILIGALLGSLLVFLLFGGVPRAAQTPGVPIQPPDPGGVPAGTAQIVLRQDFFNEVLGTIFRDMNDPSFPLGLSSTSSEQPGVAYGLQQGTEACDGTITLLPEGSGVRTGLVLENNKLGAPLAFSGSYNSPFGCLRFTGWAQASLDLRYDASQQKVFGQINVETVNLDGVNPVLSGFVTPIVQSTLNNRVNPIQVLEGRQIALSVPIAATNATLMANVADVRADVKDNALNLYVIYNFNGAPLPPQQ